MPPPRGREPGVAVVAWDEQRGNEGPTQNGVLVRVLKKGENKGAREYSCSEMGRAALV